jgi:ABC-type branched-subunit amino acid transport system substrate-binding protein
MAVLSSACGSMLSHRQLLAADRRGGGGTSGGAPGADFGSAGAIEGAGATGAAGGGAGGGAPGGAGGATGSAGAAGAGRAGSAAAVPAGGNGGATDVGVTGDSISLGTVATLTGPVPGLFRGATLGVQACVARVNSEGGIFGRKLKSVVGDDQFNQNQNRAQTAQLAPKVLAFTGSFSVYDGGMADTLKSQNIPDIGEALPGPRADLTQHFDPQPNPPGWITGPFAWLKAKYPDAVGAVGNITGDVPSAITEWKAAKQAMQSQGYKITYEGTYEPGQTDFTADVLRMKSAGVKFLYIVGDQGTYEHFLQNAHQQGWKPEVVNLIFNAYDPTFISIAGADVAEGVIVTGQSALYDGEDAGSVPEIATMLSWFDRIERGYKPDIFALYGWLSCEMFTDAAKAIGSRLTRQALLAQMAKLTRYDGNGIIGVGNPAQKLPTTCYGVYQIKGAKWVRLDPQQGFRCDGQYLYLK